jgi:hypothetical protein
LHSRPSSRGNVSLVRLKQAAREDDGRGSGPSDDLDKWGGWADDIQTMREQEANQNRRIAERNEAAAASREQAAKHQEVMRGLKAATRELRDAGAIDEGAHFLPMSTLLLWTDFRENVAQS